LKYSYGVGGTQNRDSAGETDTTCSCRRCSENDGGSGVEELPAVMFTDAKGVQAHLIGMFDLFDEVSQTVRRAHSKTAVVERGCETVNPNLHLLFRSRVSTARFVLVALAAFSALHPRR